MFFFRQKKKVKKEKGIDKEKLKEIDEKKNKRQEVVSKVSDELLADAIKTVLSKK
ncbi:MAG: hypothetical protein N4A57_17740 [Anaeromicrobium sp.]|jgi:hypothetical protein|uniref:hypothetical protein n=1 Tax=Anaeromicrobium sp. TaxID=1929132 RepID=UPI0025D4ABC6|nr:hypothetical protein [Anaeromicrobium sp.]MCT4596093.1 hypothetical protein [Anaeromicrobium sp.]